MVISERRSVVSWVLASLIFGVIAFTVPGHAADTLPDLLTPAERAWLAAHPEIRLGVGEEWEPWVVRRESGEVAGFASDHLALLGRKLQSRFRLEAGPWRTIVAKAAARELDGLTLSAPLPEREEHFLFTDSFHDVHYFTFLRTGDPADGSRVEALNGKRVGYLKGVLRVEKLLAAHSGVVAAPKETQEELALGLLENELDAVIDSYALEYWRASHGVFGFTPTRILVDQPPNLVLSVRKDWPELVGILNKGLAAITAAEMADLYRRWFGADYLRQLAAERVALTAAERAWLADRKVLRAGIDPSWAPVEFVDERGMAQGISAAYLKRLETLLGVRFEIVIPSNWGEARRQLEAGALDFVPAATMTADRQTTMRLTEPYASFPAAIFSAAEVAYVGGLDALRGKAVAVIRGEAAHDWLQADWPRLELVPVADTQEGIKAVAAGRAFAFVGNLVTTSYYIGQTGLTQVKVAGDTPYQYRLGMAVRQDLPLLAGILQKGLDAIPQNERDAIYHDWISITYQHLADYGPLWQVVAGATLVLLVVLYWNRRLTREVGRRRAAEAALRDAKNAADLASRTKSELLANVSHDLRTPLNAVLGFAQLLERDRTLDARQHEHVRGIRRGGERLLALINEVLDLARIEAGRVDLAPVEWDTTELLRELREMFRPRAEAKGLTLTIVTATALPRTLHSDAKCLHQVLVNLLDNAIKYTAAGSVTLRFGFEAGQLDLEIADTGIGIPADSIGRIFEPFQQIGAGESRSQGTGLGLAITKGLVERMGGTLVIESAPGAGSTFRVQVPATAVEAGAAPAGSAIVATRITGFRRTDGGQELRILVTDDEAENREVLRGLLEPLGFRVALADSGMACLEKAEADPPDLVLMDLRMPVMDGIEATRRLRERPGLRDVPVVAVTAAAFATDRDQALAAGFDAHLPKPVLLDALLETLGALLPLEWVRGAPLIASEPLAQEHLSPGDAERLARLLRTGSITAIRALAVDWARNGCCPTLARRVGGLADAFDVTGLRRLAEELVASAGSDRGGQPSGGP
jgi:signal transduction histidine kinase/DNA-binding NarL/FixJ family response regulator